MSGDVLTKIPGDRHNFAVGAARNLKRIKDKIRTVKPGENIATGLRAIDTAGHTQGHIAIEIVSGNEAILVIGDALAHPVIAFEHPDWRPAADQEPERAAATRKALLSRLASDKTHIVGYHLRGGKTERSFLTLGNASILSRHREKAGYFGYTALPSSVRLNEKVLGNK